MNRFPLITAHSGCMGTLDNTVDSVTTALRLGADVVEEDIRVTRDGVPVLAHDDGWYTAGGDECSISKLTFAEIQALTIAVVQEGKTKTMRICRLEEILPLIKKAGATINLDIKVDDCIQSVAELVRTYELGASVILSGCERERARMVQHLHPELPKLLNAESGLFLSLPYEEAIRQTCRDAMETGCIGVNIHYRLVRPELMEYASSQGLPVYVWTVNDLPVMEDFIEMGVHSITTRDVQSLVGLKRRHLERTGRADTGAFT